MQIQFLLIWRDSSKEMEINFTADKQELWNVNANKSLAVLNYAKQWRS